MKCSQLLKQLKQAGWYVAREGKGSHKILKHPINPEIILFPDHGSSEMARGTEKAIKKQAGLK